MPIPVRPRPHARQRAALAAAVLAVRVLPRLTGRR